MEGEQRCVKVRKCGDAKMKTGFGGCDATPEYM